MDPMQILVFLIVLFLAGYLIYALINAEKI
ncbi:MAG: hypothetical protein BWY83_00448 [bacterium ADurb.Bin478]|nr:MAG: hypothetical protein BWY83_00448 [bacterium ADurb.Bin478]